MSKTLLSELVRRQASSAVFGVFSRTVDKVAEEMALDLLRDPEVRDQLRQLVKVAFDQALAELQAPPPPETERDPVTRVMLQRMEDRLVELERERKR
jgi:hypothetical protein